MMIMNWFKQLKQLPVQLALSMLLAFFLGPWIPQEGVVLFYTLSHALIDVLLFTLPFIVFSLMLRALLQGEGRRSLYLIGLLFAGVTASNFIALLFAYGIGLLVLPALSFEGGASDFAQLTHSIISPAFTLPLPYFMETNVAMVLGIVIGALTHFLPPTATLKMRIERLSVSMNDWVAYFLSSWFIPLLPFYVFGFCLKLSFDKTLITLVTQYGKVFFLNFLLVGSYLFVLYLIGTGGRLRKALQAVQTMIPAGMMGFSTMSSAVTMPVTLQCVTKTTRSKQFAELVIPATANIHMLSDDITITMMVMTLMSLFGMPWPDLATFIPFAFAFSCAKLSCVGVPGASVLVILPVVQAYMGFTPEMITLVTTLYILQDACGTAMNVMGNGAFALVLQRGLARIGFFQRAL